MLYLFTFVVAFCSIAYELVLGQALSLFLGNTILRFSVTIGIYMFAMGVGAMVAEGKIAQKKEKIFMLVEALLVLVGGFAPILLFLTQSLVGSGVLFLIFALTLIFTIGVLTGFEIPLLMELLEGESKVKNSEGKILGIDYLGAFIGSLVFALIFYPNFGLLQTAFSIALLNCVVGILFYLWYLKLELKRTSFLRKIFNLQIILLAVLLGALAMSENLTEVMVSLYLK